MKKSVSLKNLLTSAAGMAIIAAVPVQAADTVIQDGETRTTDIDLGGTDTLTIEDGGALSVNGEAVEWVGPSTALVITNNGTIESTRADTRAFDTAGNQTAPRVITFTNGATGVVQSEADAIRINVDITDGSVLLDNAGLIVSTKNGQALDFDSINSTGPGDVTIINRAGGEIRSTDADAIRPGENAVVDNSGLIHAASGPNISSDAVDLQGHFATIINRTGGVISGARHGITTDTDLEVVNEVGGLIEGRNGSGIGSDGVASRIINYGTIRGTFDLSYPFGDGDGIDIDGKGYVENFGLIEALGAFGSRPDGRGTGSDGVTFGAPGGTLINHAGAKIYSVTTGVAFANQVTVINAGWIEGGLSGIGVGNSGDDLVINSGTVIGGPAYGILLSGGDDTLIIRRGSRIVGTVIGGDDTDLLRLEDGAVFETSTQFEILEVAGAVELTGDNTFDTASIEADSTLTVAQTANLDVTASGLQLLGTNSALVNRGAILGSVLGSANSDTVTNSGSITAASTAISLMGGNDRLVLQAGSAISGLVDGGSGTDTLALESTGLPQDHVGFELLDITGNVLVTSNALFDGTTINPLARLTLGDGGTTGGVGFNITNNGTLAVNRSNDVLFDAAVTGTGDFIQAGTGSLRLTATNTYAGTTTVERGTLMIGDGATSGSVAGPIVNNGALVFDRSDSLVVSQGISGTGTLTHAGTGTVRLTANNDLGGLVTIDRGTLVIGNGSTSGRIGGNIVNNGTLVSDRSDVVLFNNVISGSGSFVQAGTGTLRLTANNTFTGTTTVERGTLVIGNSGTSGSVTGPIVNNGALVFDRSDSVVFNGLISGTGGLAQAGTGTLRLTANNSYTGTTTVERGTLVVGNGGTSGTVAGPIVNNGALVFDRSDSVMVTQAISGTGTLTHAGTGTVRLGGDSSLSGVVTIERGTLILGNGAAAGRVGGLIVNNGTFVSDRSDVVMFNGVISGSGGFVQAGSGGVLLVGNNSYTGPTRITAGELVLNGTINSAVSVEAGRFYGAGQVAALTVASGATAGIASGPATLVVSGNLAVASGARIEMTVSANAADLFDVGGTAALGGGAVVLQPLFQNFGPRTEYTLLTADGGLTGTFSTVAVTDPQYSYLAPQLVYTSSAVRLILRRTDIDFAATARNVDQATVANVIEALPLTNALRDQVLVLSSTQAPLAYESLGGEIHGSTASMIVENDLRLRDRMLASVDTTLEGASLWAQAFTSSGKFTGNDAARTDTELKGFAGGVTYGFGPLSLALAGGFTQSEAEAAGGLGLSDVDTSFVGAMAEIDLPLIELRGGLTYSSHDVDSSRVTTVGAATTTLSSDHSMHSVMGFADVAFTLIDGAVFAVKPVAGYSFVSLGGQGFAETGGISALTGDASDRSVQLATLGLRLEAGAGVPMLGGISPRLEARWQRAMGDREGLVAAQFQTGGAPFTVAGHGIDKNQLLLDAGVAANVGPVNLGLSYLGSIGSDYSQHGGQVTLGISF